MVIVYCSIQIRYSSHIKSTHIKRELKMKNILDRLNMVAGDVTNPGDEALVICKRGMNVADVKDVINEHLCEQDLDVETDYSEQDLDVVVDVVMDFNLKSALPSGGEMTIWLD